MRESANDLPDPQESRRPSPFAAFGRGFLAVLPLWTGAIPVGIAYGVAAQAVGLSPGATQLMSLVVFSAAAQVSAVSLLGGGAPSLVLVGTAMALNAQLLLLGLAVGRQVRAPWSKRLILAWFLTDGAYGVTVARGRVELLPLLGAGVSMFVAWNAGTGLGIAAGHAVTDPRRLGIDFVAPLTFLAVLVPLVRTRPLALVALVSGLATLLLGQLVPGGIAVLGAAVVGSAAGAWSTRHVRASPASSAAVDEDRGTR